MKEQTSLGQWLKQRCRGEHLSLREAAARTGLSHSVIANIIKGNKPAPETIKKLVQGFGGTSLQRLALEDQLLTLAGYLTPRPEGSTEENHLKMVPLLSPEHQHVIELVVMELAKIEGSEIPTSDKEAPGDK